MSNSPNYICFYNSNCNKLCFDLNTISEGGKININLSDYNFSDRISKIEYSDAAKHKYHVVLWTEPNQTGNPYHVDDSVDAVPQEVKSIEIYEHQGIWLCEGKNYEGNCVRLGGDLIPEDQEAKLNLDDPRLKPDLTNKVQSVKYDSDYDGKYHIVLYSKRDQEGESYQADHSVPDLKDPYNNNIESVKIYRNK